MLTAFPLPPAVTPDVPVGSPADEREREREHADGETERGRTQVEKNQQKPNISLDMDR